jgi:hypothetical protein
VQVSHFVHGTLCTVSEWQACGLASILGTSRSFPPSIFSGPELALRAARCAHARPISFAPVDHPETAQLLAATEREPRTEKALREELQQQET